MFSKITSSLGRSLHGARMSRPLGQAPREAQADQTTFNSASVIEGKAKIHALRPKISRVGLRRWARSTDERAGRQLRDIYRGIDRTARPHHAGPVDQVITRKRAPVVRCAPCQGNGPLTFIIPREAQFPHPHYQRSRSQPEPFPL